MERVTTTVPTRQELEALHCWEADDRVGGRAEMTGFRRLLRWHQARWRERHGHPIGSQPIAPRPGQRSRPVGSRIPLAYGMETGANLVTPAARAAARARTSMVEAHQSFDHQRLWADLLWSPALAFNLFGDLAADHALATRALRRWWPDTPGRVGEVRFAHSPGRFDWSYLGSLRDFDTAFLLDLPDGARGILAVRVKYHDAGKRHVAKPVGRPRQREVAARAGVFTPGFVDAVDGTDLLVMSLEHLLALSMAQHPSGAWRWARYAVVHAAGNSDYADACARYADGLREPSTFSSLTVEELLGAGGLPAATVAALRERYLPG